MKLNRRREGGELGGGAETTGGKNEHPNLFLVFAGCSLQGHPERLACNYSVLIEDNELDI